MEIAIDSVTRRGGVLNILYYKESDIAAGAARLYEARATLLHNWHLERDYPDYRISAILGLEFAPKAVLIENIMGKMDIFDSLNSFMLSEEIESGELIL